VSRPRRSTRMGPPCVVPKTRARQSTAARPGCAT